MGDAKQLPPAEVLEAALGGVVERNGVLVPQELERASAGTFATTPALPPVTFDHVRLAALEIENARLKAQNQRLALILRQRWIRCSERMPPVGERVLALDPTNGVYTAKRWVERSETFEPDENPSSVTRPTHWMPLPEAPEGG